MIDLGMKHMSEGIDHLLFLLMLLLPAPLFVSNKKWGQYGGLKYSLIKLIKIITAFTVIRTHNTFFQKVITDNFKV